MFKSALKKISIHNPHVSSGEVVEELKKEFPDFSIRCKKSGSKFNILMKRGIVRIRIVRIGKGYIFIQKYASPFLDLITLGAIEIIEPIVGNKERLKVALLLQNKFSLK